MAKKCKLKKYLTKQWSFMMAGIVFGVAQIIYMIGLIAPSFDKAMDTWKIKPITVTTDLGKMFRGLEVWVNNLFGFTSELYGTYTEVAGEMISNWGAFIPWVGPAIVGMIIGWALVALAERQNKLWVKYSGRLLIVAFIGWMFFSYGTRLAGGCTLNHLLGWVPMMNIHSMVAIIFMSLWGLTGFWLMTKLDLAKYFKHQEEFDYVKAQYKKGTNDGITYDPNYKPYKNILVWIGLTFTLAFVWVAIYGMLVSPEFLQNLKGEEMKAFNKSISGSGLAYVIITLFAGIIAGFAMWKSGFGTECALISAEASAMIRKDEKKWNKMGLPNVTRTLFKGLLPLQWVAAMWVIVSAFVVIAVYFLGMKHGFGWSVKYELTLWVPIGGFFLGFGAVLLIGCEIRSYMRLGMLYLNTLIWFIGFAIGYLPFTLYYAEHKAFLSNTSISNVLGTEPVYTFPELIAGTSHTGQTIVAVLWFLMLVWILTWSIKAGKKYMNVKKSWEFLTKNTGEIHEEYGDEMKGKVK